MTRLFTWQENFLTRLPSVDEQHRQLVDMINDLAELVVSTREADTAHVPDVLPRLRDYIRYHFADEESLIERVGLDRRHADGHRAAHRAFAAELDELVGAQSGVDLDRVRWLIEYLVRWFAYHILDVDQAMARQIRAVEGGATPAEAFDRDEKDLQLGTQPLLAALSGLFYAVSERNRELRTLNRDLEARVAQRTAELEETNRRLHVLATEDDLTALPNRRFAMISLARLWQERARYGGSLSVVLLDADRFKSVNDRFGHPQGDLLLRALAERLRRGARESDIVCRLGGDEFVVICPQSDHTAAMTVAHRFLEASTPLRTSSNEECWSGALSIGVAEAEAKMARVEELLAAADRALYAAKGKGGAQAVDAFDLPS